MNSDQSGRKATEANSILTDREPQRSFISDETHKTSNFNVVDNASMGLSDQGLSESHWCLNSGSVCEETNDVRLSPSNICIADISENCDENHETNSNSSQSESLSFLDSLLDLASSFSQPQKNLLETPELHSRSFSKGGSDLVLSPPTPTLQVSPKVVVRFTDIRNGLGRAALSTSFEENRSPTDVTLRNITKMLCSPRNGTQTPRGKRRVSAGVPPTSSVARKMEFSPQTKSNRRQSRIAGIHKFQLCDGTGSNVDHDSLLAGSIFSEDVTGHDAFANVPKPTRNLYIPDVLLSSGSCRSNSVNFNARTTDVGSSRGSDCHINESWQFGILSPSSLVTTFDIGSCTNSKTNSLSCEPTISQGTCLSPKAGSSFWWSNPYYRSGLLHLSPPSEVRLLDSIAQSGNTLPHISTFSHLPDGQESKSAFTPVVRNYTVSHNVSTAQDNGHPFFTSVTSLATADTSPPSVAVTPVKHSTFSPVDMPKSLTSSFLLSPPLPGLDQFCYPSTPFVSSREVQNCRESEGRDELMTPVLEQPLTALVNVEDSLTGPISSISHADSSVPPSVSLYSFDAANRCTETTVSHKGSANVTDLYNYKLPFGGQNYAHGTGDTVGHEALQKLIKASDSLRNDIDMQHAKSDSHSFPSCKKSSPAEYEIAYTNAMFAPDPVLERKSADSGTDKTMVVLDTNQGSQHGSAQKRCVSWNKSESLSETLKKRRKQLADTCGITISNAFVTKDPCPVLVTTSLTPSFTEPTIGLTSTWASGRTSVSSSYVLARGGSLGTITNLNMKVASSASTQQDLTHNMMRKSFRESTAKNMMSIRQNDSASFQACCRNNTNPESANATDIVVPTAGMSVASDNNYDLIGEPQICKAYQYTSHIRNPKKEMIQRQVYENSRRQIISETTNSTSVSITTPFSSNNDSGRASDDDSTAQRNADDPSKNASGSHTDKQMTCVHPVLNFGTPSVNPMYPQIRKFVKEYEQFVRTSQSNMTPLQLAFPPVSATASGADKRIISSVQSEVSSKGNNIDVATVSSTSDLAETRSYYPLFARLTDEQLGTYLTSKTGPPPKPRNFNMVSLQIGSFRYYTGDDNTNKMEAKVKVMFSKRKVIYELELQRSDEDRRESRCPFTTIEIPFGSIVGLNGSGTTVLLELNMMAYMFLGFRSCDVDGNFVPRKIASYNRTVHVDLTGGQLEVMPYHLITLRNNGADKLVQCLARFDKRFFLLQHIPILFNPMKRLGPWTPQVYVSPLLDSTQRFAAAFRRRQQTQSGCNCAAGCQFTRCRCVMAQLRCTDKCRCIAHIGNCVNTVNQMETVGLDIVQCKKDVCLMANVFRIKNLASYLQKRVALQCCGVTLPLRSCIPGHIACPNTPHCCQTYQYSWCNGKLYNDREGARNHCTSCCTCKEPNSVHCKTCNICYNPLLVSSYCPCNQAVIRSRHKQSTPSLDSHGGSDRSSNSSPDSATSSATSDGVSQSTVASCSAVTNIPSAGVDGRLFDVVNEEVRKRVDCDTPQNVAHASTEQKDGTTMLRCETENSELQDVSDESTDSMPSLHDPGICTYPSATVDTPKSSEGEVEAAAQRTFLHLIVPADDVGQYQVHSGVRVRRLGDPDDAARHTQTSGSSYALFCGRQWGNEAVSCVDMTDDGKCDTYAGRTSDGVSPGRDGKASVSCGSVTVRTLDGERKEGSTSEPHSRTSSARTHELPVTTDVEQFRSDAATITSPMSVRLSNRSTTKQQQCTSNAVWGSTAMRRLQPHTETIIEKSTADTAAGINTSGLPNCCVARYDGDTLSSAATQEQNDGSRPPPVEPTVGVEDIVFPSGWPAESSCPVEAVLGKPVGTSSPVRLNTHTTPVSPL